MVEMVGFLAETEIRARPVPERATLWGLPVALSLMLSDPARLPLAVGANTTDTEQLWPTFNTLSRALQLLVWVKSPEVVMAVMLRVAVPVLVIVTVCAALFELTFVLGNARVVGATVTA